MSGTSGAMLILIATVAISLFAIYGNRAFLDKWMLHPYSVVHENKWHTLITSGFIHADLFHLMFNMFSFYFFAFQLEYYVGTTNFLIIYFGSMILSDISTVKKHKDNIGYRSLGASGAVSGIIYSSILFNPLSTIYIYFIPMPAIVFAVLFLVYGYIASRKGVDYINHEAHNWGAIAGLVLTIILIPESITIFIKQIF